MQLHPPSPRALRRSCVAAALAILLSACGGGGGGSSAGDSPAPELLTQASFSQSSPALGKSEALQIRFNTSVDPASLVLGGSLAAEATGAWSTTVVENDTYTLSPSSGTWKSGPDRDITVSANGKAGGTVSGVTAKYLVRLVFDDFANAGTVIGQADFVSTAANQGSPTPRKDGLSGPYGSVTFAPDGRMFISDYENRRVVGFDALPTRDGAEAALALGQPDLVTLNLSRTPSRTLMGPPQSVSIAGGKMAVTDFGWSRILVYNAIPTASGTEPDVVVGQPGFTTQDVGCGPLMLKLPEASFLTPNGKLIVADSGNHRVLIWNTVPTAAGQAPDIVLGQSRLDTCAENDGDQDGIADATPNGQTLYDPQGIWSDGTRLALIDRMNNRVLIWNTFPISNFQTADVVLGQSTFEASTGNDDNQDGVPGTPTARTMNAPTLGIASNGVQLALADDRNHRVLVWNTFPTSDFQPADMVLGQKTFAGKTLNDDNQDGVDDGPPTARTLFMPTGVAFYQDKLVVTDYGNNRLLVFKSK